MKLFDVDWARVLDYAEHWERLSQPARLRFADLKSQQIVHEHELAGDWETLVSAGILTENKDGSSARLHREAGEFARVMRALFRFDVLTSPSRRGLVEYLAGHFSHDQRRALLGDPYAYGWSDQDLAHQVSALGWPRSFLELKDADDWAYEHTARRGRPEQPYLTRGTLPVAQRLVRLLMATGEPVPLGELREQMAPYEREEVGRALRACVRYALVFPGLRAPDRVPVAAIWPGIQARLNRPAAEPPRAVRPEEEFHSLALLNDLTIMVVAAVPPGLRLRGNDYRLFARAEKQLMAELPAFPEWVVAHHPSSEVAARVAQAVRRGVALELLESVGEPGVDLRLQSTRAGEDWLALGEKKRLLTLLESERRSMADVPARGGRTRLDHPSDEDPDELDPDGDERDDFDDLFYLELDGDPDVSGLESWLRPALLRRGVRWRASIGQSLREAIVNAGSGASFTPIGEFLRFHVRERNPLLTAEPRKPRFGFVARPPTEEDLEKCWEEQLAKLLGGLIILGGVALGRAGDGAISFRVTDIGRYVLNAQDDFELEVEPTDKARIVVQPNFEIAFLGPSASLEARLGRFCERVGKGVGIVFRITRASAFRAAAAGMSADEVVATLADVSGTDVPKNVVREIRGWFQRCRRLRLETVALIRCPDAETAMMVLAAGRKQVRALSDTVVEYVGSDPVATFVRKLRESGVFLDQVTRPSSGSRRRGRR